MSRYPNDQLMLPRTTVVDASYREGGRLLYNTQELPSRIYAQLSPRTPGYKRIKKEGGRLPMNNYYSERALWSNCNGYRFISRTEVDPPRTSILDERNGLMYTANTPSEYISRYLYNTKFLWEFVPQNSDLVNSALKNVAHGPDVMTFIAELRDVKLLHKDVVRALRKIGRGYFSAAWMTYRYGFLPLMYAIKDFAEYSAAFVEELHKPRGTLTHGTSSTVTYEPDLRSFDFTKVTGDWGCQNIIHNQHVTAKGSLYYRVNGMTQMKSTLNINPWLTAWELVPLSFAIDWLVDIGSMLDACTVSTALAEPEVAICTKWEFESNASAKGSKPQDPFYVWRKKDELSPSIPYLHTSYDATHRENFGFRHVIKSRGVSRPAQVYPEMAKFRPSMNLERYIDAMSLYSIFTDKELSYTDTKRLLR